MSRGSLLEPLATTFPHLPQGKSLGRIGQDPEQPFPDPVTVAGRRELSARVLLFRDR